MRTITRLSNCLFWLALELTFVLRVPLLAIFTQSFLVYYFCFKGGKKFCTTIDTLTQRDPESMLAAMFSGRHTICQDSEKGYIFVDRDGKHFRHILNWLRDGFIPALKDYEYSELLREAEYFQLLGLTDGIKASLSRRKEEEEMGTELTRIDIIKCIQSDRVKFRGVNLSGLDLSKLVLHSISYCFSLIQLDCNLLMLKLR
ncbi:hypothetical protein RD792_010968 [Penstemon davidsonii]|uniref:BTB domain-containing protein n=1 Tax=Penstemon davidsonii TaxID=160366 RepID=A0ABR0D398_9LAMI|nr:hypothetical protein RD792_010968 [Penstemon davidsonii]